MAPSLPSVRANRESTTMANEITDGMTSVTAADGFTLEAFRATPAGAPKGGLVILQEIFGITDQLKNVVRSYARDGYDTIIPALYDRVAPGTVVPFSEPDRGRAGARPRGGGGRGGAAGAGRGRGPRGGAGRGGGGGGGGGGRAAAGGD